MSIEDAEAHFRWIGIIADRIICAKESGNQLPLLSLSFLGEPKNIPNFSKFERPTFPITIDNLADGKLYAIIIYAFFANKKTQSNPHLSKVYDILNENLLKRNELAISESEFDCNFDSILNNLSLKGYRPKKPCDSTGLTEKDIEHHINLCKSIEFIVVDKSLRTDLLTSDLRRLPRTFFTFQRNVHFDHLEDAVALWLSKFHCNPFFTREPKIGNSKYENESSKLIKQYKLHLNDKNYCLQIDTSKYSKVAACLAKIFPKQIDKNEIKDGINEEEIQFNRDLSQNILNELHAFYIDDFPCDERLFLLFISDLYYATRECNRDFIKLEITRQPTFVPRHQPILIHNYQLARPKVISVFSYTKKPLLNDIKSGNNMINVNRIELFKPPLKPRAKTQQKIVKPTIEQTPLPPLKSVVKPQIKEKNHFTKTHKKSQNKKQNKINHAKEESIEEEEDTNDQSENQNSTQQIISDIQPIESKQEEKKVETEKKQIKKYEMEFPEIEILLKRLIEKYPEQNNYFIDLYDAFMRTILEAYAMNSPKVSDIFKRAQSTFQLLLEGQKIDYDFELMLSNMIKKKS